MRRIALSVVVLLAGSCTAPEPAPAPTSSLGPYTVTAIDYHFHDAHPSLPISLDRTVRFTNVGRNPHNVTFQTVDYHRELPVDGELRIEPISEVVPGPGRYRFFCSYHRDRKMTGVLVVV